MLRNLSIALLTNERIVTTVPKAKALRRVVEPLITLAKKGDLAARRRALQILPHKKTIQKLFNEIGPRYAERNGGYTRILKLAVPRHGDAAPLAMIELVGFSEKQRAEAQKAAAEEKKKAKGIRQRLKDKVGKGGAQKTAAVAKGEEKSAAMVKKEAESGVKTRAGKSTAAKKQKEDAAASADQNENTHAGEK